MRIPLRALAAAAAAAVLATASMDTGLSRWLSPGELTSLLGALTATGGRNEAITVSCLLS
jgi:hypothetical protein